jgi:predicted DNA-binding protein (MmcQ/YjbR family)
MVTIRKVKTLAMQFPETEEAPHFEKTSFRVGGKIFATLNEKDRRVTVKLGATDQDLFCLVKGGYIYPVPNKWGKQGWTIVELPKVTASVLKEVFKTAYCIVAPSRLSKLVQPD